MNTSQRDTSSYWRKTTTGRYARLTSDGHFDVVVVGGGITGLSAAYFLKRAGKHVALVERDRLGSADTGNTTAHLTSVVDLRISQLAARFGEAAARQVWHAGEVAIAAIEQNVRDLHIECEFRHVPGYLVASLESSKKQAKPLEKEAASAQQLGISARFRDSDPFFGRPAVQFADQALFHPLKYLAGMAKAFVGDGCAIFEHVEVEEVTDDPLTVKVAGRKLTADQVVIATHVPLMGKSGLVSASLFQTKLYPYTSYVVGGKAARGAVPQASFWDASDPYYYLRVDPGKTADYVIFGGQDHKTGQEADTESRFAKLTATLKNWLPDFQPDHHWSGQVIETADGLPYIGEIAPRQFVATGFSGNGMTYGTLAGLMARDWVLKKNNPWSELFAVSRKKLRGGLWNFVSENLDFPYYYLKDRMAGSAGDSPRVVKRGEGKIIVVDGQKVACSRDDAGKTHLVSAICTHLGCLVRWNTSEKTWDCPCHGSRFRPNGEVLAGPAETALEPVVSKKQPAKQPGRKRGKSASERKSG